MKLGFKVMPFQHFRVSQESETLRKASQSWLKRRISHNFERFLENEGLWPTSTCWKWIWAGIENKSPARKVRNFHCKSKFYANSRDFTQIIDILRNFTQSFGNLFEILRKFSESWSVCEMRSSQANLPKVEQHCQLRRDRPWMSITSWKGTKGGSHFGSVCEIRSSQDKVLHVAKFFIQAILYCFIGRAKDTKPSITTQSPASMSNVPFKRPKGEKRMRQCEPTSHWCSEDTIDS